MIRALFILVALLAGLPGWGANVPEPEDFRQDQYRGPVPATLQGALVVETEAAFALWYSKRVAFIDVLPQAPRPEGLPEGTIWRDKPRHSIPGSLWLPNVGYGRIARVTADYFKAGLSFATKGDQSHPLVFFCLADCWMSWNSAKRAIEYGYSNVFWYPDGTDGWVFFDHPRMRVKPFVQ